MSKSSRRIQCDDLRHSRGTGRGVALVLALAAAAGCSSLDSGDEQLPSAEVEEVGSSEQALSGWVTDWIDNFDGTTLNTSNWTPVVGTDGEVNNEVQWYVNEQGVENNYWVSNGTLVIKLQKEARTFAGRTKNYTSARLTTKGKRDFANGAWETRLLFWSGGPNGVDGVWPAAWLLGSGINEQPYPGGACWPTWYAREIDMFEFTMNENAWNPPTQGRIITNFIWGSQCQQPASVRQDPYVNAWAWHTYRTEFNGGVVKVMVDGTVVNSVSDAEFKNQNMHAVLNVALGGNLGQGVYFDSGSYAGITVDYVKHETLTASGGGASTTVTVDNGLWGDWQGMKYCNAGTYVADYRLRVEANQGSGDDTGLNGLAMWCEAPNGTGGHEISVQGNWGDWGGWASCSGTNNFINGAQLLNEASQGTGDDTATNSINAKCGSGQMLYPPNGGPWGNWTAWGNCPAGQAVCGFNARIEAPQGSADDTSFNGLQLACCSL